MIIDQLQDKNNLTNAEKQLADFTLQNLAEATELSSADFAKKTFTSKATIIRFCKKLGLSGFVEFQKTLVKELAEANRLASILKEEPIDSNTTYSEVITIIPSMYEKAVTETRLSIDKQQLFRILNRLKNTSKIDFYGLGVTHSIAQSAAFKFSTLGVEAEAHSGLNEHYVVATKKKKNRIAILLSFTGANSQLIAIAKYLKRNGTYIIGIGDFSNNELSKYCADYIGIYQKKLVLSMEIITAITATNYIIDVLFVSNLIDHYQDHTKNSIEVIRQKGQNLSELET